MALDSNLHKGGQNMDLLSVTLTTAVTASVTDAITKLSGMGYLTVEAILTYGSGGTSTKVWVQTSLDQGTTWIDVMCFAFTTSSASKVSAVVSTTALAAGATPTDGTLADNTILSGLLGDRIRLKYTTTGTYAGGTTLVVSAVAKG